MNDTLTAHVRGVLDAGGIIMTLTQDWESCRKGVIHEAN